jgi:hypothetical protein
MALNLKRELEALVDALVAEPVEFALCGGIAVAIHGAPRFTRDIDLLVPAHAVPAAKAVARRLGFTLGAGPMTLGTGSPTQRTLHRLSKPEEGDVLTVDLVVAEGFLRDVWSSAILVEWEGRRIPVVSRSGLVTMKRAAGRPQDLVDIQNLGRVGDEPDRTD